MVRNYGNMRADLVFSQKMVCQKCNPTGCNKKNVKIMSCAGMTSSAFFHCHAWKADNNVIHKL